MCRLLIVVTTCTVKAAHCSGSLIAGTGSRVCGLGSRGTQAQLSYDMWDFPGPGIEWRALYCEADY